MIRKLQLLWCRLLTCALGFSTVDYATTCVFDDVGASPCDFSLLRFSSIRPDKGLLRIYLSSCSFDLQTVEVVTVSVLFSVC